ncbi:GNAT family N-acetyltransferase [Planococcus versutus]|uniref:GNAT family N-acetyltransferase n=1 Tax=Planococcus versutus TaxID=1302659 RepID=A0A1B1S3I7_9BACL|nr:GNAT family N-acetyltransferase [Planococcus versutus]ANU27709.1 GNAT family N-acetyltransferase [Planococcus versutus]
MYELISIQEQSRWQRILDGLNITDIYYTNQYFLSALKLDPGVAVLFYYKDEDGEVAYPFIKRVVNNEDVTVFDVTTPYGYGGPIVKVKKDQQRLVNNFRKEFVEYCYKEKIIAEYIRFHPLKQNDHLFNNYFKISTVFETFTINLKNYSIPIQTNGDLVVKKLGTVRHLFEFLVLYYSSVRRKEETDSYFFFTNDYFEALISSMGSNLHLFGVYQETKLVSACYVLAKGDTIYYHLEGSLSEANYQKTMRTLLEKIAEWGKENYYTSFHLGSNFYKATSENSIKKEIANCEPVMFTIGQQIYDQEIYNRLVSLEDEDIIRKYRNS